MLSTCPCFLDNCAQGDIILSFLPQASEGDIILVTCKAWFELAHECDFDVENIIAKKKIEVCNMEEYNFLVILFVRNLAY